MAALVAFASGCGGGSRSEAPTTTQAAKPVTSIVLVTIDTLRADRVGAYGWRAARTPAVDALAARGVRFERAYAAAPITLTSHASLLTGLYPPAHGARHNGMRLRADVPTLADTLHARGFATGAFVAAFPLDRRFGLNRGFTIYSDTLPRAPDGRPRNERPGSDVVDEALAWLAKREGGAAARVFLWVHLFEPHAPYEGDRARPASDRYDDEVAKADAQVARLVQAVDASSTLFIITGDHGEAFGEHGEIGHSIFVYDTTLRVPLVMAGAGLQPRVVSDPVSLVDVMPTILALAGLPAAAQSDGVSLMPALTGGTLGGGRALYAESFAPLFDFGWSPLRSLRADGLKYIAAPKPELYDVTRDAEEAHNAIADQPDVAKTLATRIERAYAGNAAAGASMPSDPEALARLRSLGYLAGAGPAKPSASANAANANAANAAKAGAEPVRADPKDRIALASRIAEVTSGELRGAALRSALEGLVREDPKNGQMQMRLGYVLLEAGDCRPAVPHFEAAIAAAVPSADPQLGLAECLTATGQPAAARRALAAADRIEPGNPIVAANLGMLALEDGNATLAIERLRAALDRAPDLHQARFALARAYGRAGQRADAAREARELLQRLPPDAPQRAEVQRLLAAVQ